MSEHYSCGIIKRKGEITIMKLLLLALNSQYIHSNPAVYSLRACAGVYRNQVEIMELTINHHLEQITERVYSSHPDVIAVSCYIWNIAIVKELLADLALLMPEVPIWLGGPEVSYHSEKILTQHPEITGIMVGEGEKSFAALCAYYCEGIGALNRISGLVTHDFQTGAPKVADMDEIPFWYEDGDFHDRIVYYESARGCPYNCSYCLSSAEHTLRFRSLEATFRDIQWFLDHETTQVKFIDRTFNCNRERARSIWRYLQTHDNGCTNFHFEIAGDILEDEDFAIISTFRPGLVQFEIGVQSTNQHTLREIARNCDIDKLRENIAQLHTLQNVHIHLDLIAGLPYEDFISFRNSFNDVYMMRPEQLQLGFLKVLSGTAMEKQAFEYGLLYSNHPPYEVLYTDWISYEEVLRLKRTEEMLDMYYNSNQFVYTLRLLEKAFPDAFTLYDTLAKEYEEHGYRIQSPSRVYRYEILLEFAQKYDKNNYECYRELLTYDMYLRENVKARPAFASDEKDDKEVICNFYRKEEQERTYLPEYESYTAKQMIRMTHMEGFCYPVWASGSQKLPEKTFVIFDYAKRDPLTMSAATIRIW